MPRHEPSPPGPADPASSEGELSKLSEASPRLTVELHPSGRMRAPHPGARELLRDRLRNAQLLPCEPGWMVLRAIGPSEVAPPDPRRVVAAGVLGEHGLSLIDFVGFLENGDESGQLVVAHENVERSLFLQRGAVVWASSTAPEEQLGRLLVQRAGVAPEQIERLRKDPATRGRLGAACISHGLLSPEAVEEMMRAQLVEVFDQILGMNEGVWSFARVPPEVVERAPVQMSAQSLLMDALRRLDEMQVYRQRVRSMTTRVRRVPGAERALDGATVDLVQRLDHGDLAGLVVERLEQPATVEQIMGLVGDSEFAVTRAVYQLLRSNLVEIVEDAEDARPRGPTATVEEAHAIAEVYSMAIREVFDEVAHLGQSSALRSAARGFLADEAGAGASAALLRHVVILPDGTLDEDSVLRGVASLQIPAVDLSDALSELLFFALFQATELLGRRRGDDLARRVKMIHTMLGAEPAPEGL